MEWESTRGLFCLWECQCWSVHLVESGGFFGGSVSNLNAFLRGISGLISREGIRGVDEHTSKASWGFNENIHEAKEKGAHESICLMVVLLTTCIVLKSL